MFLPIPVGVESTARGIPRLTLALIIVNVVVFLLTHSGSQGWTDPGEGRLEQIAAWELKKAGEGNPALTERVAAHPSALAFLAKDSHWEHDVKDAESRALLGTLLTDYQAIASTHVAYRLGLKPGAFSIVSLFTSMFLHVDGVHLLFNMLFLWVAGSILEATWGEKLYVPLYLLLGVAAGLVYTLFSPGSLDPAVGASGAIAGLMGAMLVHHARTPMNLVLIYGLGLAAQIKFVTVPAWLFLVAWIIEQIYWALMASGGSLRVAFSAHIGGFAAGVVAGMVVSQMGLAMESRRVLKKRLVH